MPRPLEIRRLRNAPVRDLPPAARQRFTLATSVRRYAANLCLRAVHNETRRHAKAVLAEVYQVAVLDHMDEEREKADNWQATLDSLKKFATTLPTRAVKNFPEWSDAEKSLPAARLSELTRRTLDLPLLRMVSGKEMQVPYPRNASLHDFYQICRKLLQLRPNESLALLRAGPGQGDFHQRLLHCSRDRHAATWVKRMVFDVVVHK